MAFMVACRGAKAASQTKTAQADRHLLDLGTLEFRSCISVMILSFIHMRPSGAADIYVHGGRTSGAPITTIPSSSSRTLPLSTVTCRVGTRPG